MIALKIVIATTRHSRIMMQPLQNYIMTCHDSQHHFSVPIYSRMFFGLLLPVGNLPLKRSSKWSRSSLASSTLIRFSWNNSPFQNGRWTERKAAEALGAYLVKGNCTASQPVNSNVVVILYHVKLNQVVKCQPKVHKSTALLHLCLQRCHSIESKISFAIPLTVQYTTIPNKYNQHFCNNNLHRLCFHIYVCRVSTFKNPSRWKFSRSASLMATMFFFACGRCALPRNCPQHKLNV